MTREPPKNLREKLYVIIFEHSTTTGKWFDIGVLIAIVLSLISVSLESVAVLQARWGMYFRIIEWILTGLFTVEYVLRLYCSPKPRKYVFSFFGLVDLLSLLPTYLAFFFVGTHSLLAIRALRLLRVFRVLKLARFDREGLVLIKALWASRFKVSVFLGSVLSIVIIMGTVMHLVEGPEHGFDSIPRGMYWAIVTLTTVGYGDITPKTILGQSLSSLLMILGYAIIAVPTGIVTSELTAAKTAYTPQAKKCESCGSVMNVPNVIYCPYCGTEQ